MNKSIFIKDNYVYNVFNGRCIVNITSDDGHYVHEIMIMCEANLTGLKYVSAVETNNKTSLSYDSVDKLEQMHKGLWEDISKKYAAKNSTI